MLAYANTLLMEFNQCSLPHPNVSENPSANVLRDNLAESFTINVLGVHWVTRTFLPLLKKGTQKKVVNM